MELASARDLLAFPPEWGEGWALPRFRGRFVELTGSGDSAALTACSTLILEAQVQGYLAAWVGAKDTSFFPPDMAACGIDLAALTVVHAPSMQRACWAVDTLLRSGSFRLVVLDLDSIRALSLSMQTRLGSLAQQHNATLIALTQRDGDTSSSGSLVSFRGVCGKERSGHNQFTFEVYAEKDKRSARGRCLVESRCGASGLC